MSAIDGPEALDRIALVSRETRDRLETLVTSLRRWQETTNLVGPSTLDQIWQRHVADSLQLVRYAPLNQKWIDIGTGAGFPGLVIAIAMRDPLLAPLGAGHVYLVEPNTRKAAFLREVIRATGAPATVHAARIESILPSLPNDLAVVTARAVTHLAALCEMIQPLVDKGAVALLMKGRDVDRELTEATRYWKMTVNRLPSLTDPDAAILQISALTKWSHRDEHRS